MRRGLALNPRSTLKHLLTVAATAGAGLLLGGCSPADVVPLEENLIEKSAAVGFVETFFEYLEEGEDAAIHLTTIPHVEEQERFVLFHRDSADHTGNPYEGAGDRPELVEATARWARPPLVMVDVSYTMGDQEVEDSILVHHRERLDGGSAGTGSQGRPRIVLSPAAFGINVDGVQYLPADTRYSISGLDITKGIRQVVTDASIPEDEKFRLPALGGTYVVDVEVPGEGGFKESLTVEALSFYGINRNENIFLEFAERHGFTEVLWGD